MPFILAAARAVLASFPALSWLSPQSPLFNPSPSEMMMGKGKIWQPPTEPLPAVFTSEMETQAIGKEAWDQKYPRWVLYWDEYLEGYTNGNMPTVSTLNQFNTFILAFLLPSGAADQAYYWSHLPASTRSSVKKAYSSAGIALMVSAFGSTEAPTSQGYDPTALANTVAAWAVKYSLDGVDIDYEDFNAINAQNGQAEAWLKTFTTQLRKKLPSPNYIITHAPVAPWFSKSAYGGGAYYQVNKQVGNIIDWYNVQFYNQDDYYDCNSTLVKSGKNWPLTSVFEISKNQGVELKKVVLGKPGLPVDADSGYVGVNHLAACLQLGKKLGFTSGVMFYEFNHANNSGMAIVRSKSFPK